MCGVASTRRWTAISAATPVGGSLEKTSSEAKPSVPCPQRRQQVVLVDEAAAGGVDEVAAGAERVEDGAVDHRRGVGGQRHVQGQVVDGAGQLDQRLVRRDVARELVDERVPDVDREAERLDPGRRLAADPTEAGDPDRVLARRQRLRDPRQRPAVLDHLPAGQAEAPVVGVDARDAVVGDLVEAVVVDVVDGDAARRRRVEVDVVEADPVADHRLQLRQLAEHPVGDRRPLDQEALRAGRGRDDLVLGLDLRHFKFELRGEHLALDAAVAEVGICDHYFCHVVPFI